MEEDFLYVIASLNGKANEMSAAEVVRVAKINNILPMDVEGFQEYAGRGLGGLVTLPDEKRPRAVIMGTREFMLQCGLEVPAILEVTCRKWENDDHAHIILVGWDGWVRGVLKFVREPNI